jgi:hypothetical protein
MKKVVLTFGLIAGVILSVLMVVTMAVTKQVGVDSVGLETGMAIGYTTMVLSFILVYFGVRSYRDTVMGGTVRFWPAFRVGLLIALIASICYAATWQVVYRTMLPTYATDYANDAIRKAEAKGASPAELTKVRAEMAKFVEAYKNPVYNFGMTLLEPSPVALLFSLVSAVVLSRKRRSGVSTLGTMAS